MERRPRGRSGAWCVWSTGWTGRTICSSVLLAAALVWMPQFAMAIEKWRIRYGPHVAGWVAAIGEFEAMSSLACFAYERPDAVFPELADSSERFYDAAGLTHPLIPARRPSRMT